MRSPNAKHHCELLGKEIFWGGYGGCYEIQEVREDNMDMELLPFTIELDKADIICEKCGWCHVSFDE